MHNRSTSKAQQWLGALLLLTVTCTLFPLNGVVAQEEDDTATEEKAETNEPSPESVPEEPEVATESEDPSRSEKEQNKDDGKTAPAEREKTNVKQTTSTEVTGDEDGEDVAGEVSASDDESVSTEGEKTEETAASEKTKTDAAEEADEENSDTPSTTAKAADEILLDQTSTSTALSESEKPATSSPEPDTALDAPRATTSVITEDNETDHDKKTDENGNGDRDSGEAATPAASQSTAATTSATDHGGTTTDQTASTALTDATSSASTELVSTSSTTRATTSETQHASSTGAAAVTIESGKAVALANVINIVNTNFVNSEGVVFFSNFLEAVNESIDLRWLYEALAQFGCSLTSCSGSDTTVTTSDTANIDNQMYIEAISGGNTIADTENGVINTGDAYAGLNLINVANMNFVDSNYLLVTLNAFNDVNGDIVFPSADAFLANLAGGGNSSIDTENFALVDNNITVDANSGDNTLETVSGGSINTGTSAATSNVFNQINSSFLGGQNVTILFRIHGDWAGEVFGAPPDLRWQEGPDGSVFVFDTDTNGAGGGSHTVLTNNTATIKNDVQVVALTGENKITGAETGVITAGNAYAGANIVNLANGTVVGRNWILAIINIFGDFKGNIAFGRPDLWVGEMIDAPKKIRDGSELTYKLSVINNGDSTATDVVLEDAYDSDHLSIVDASVPYELTDSGALKFDIGKLKSGEAAEVTYRAKVMGVGSKSREITNVVTVNARETDNDTSDNTDTVSITTTTERSYSGATKVGTRKTKAVTEIGTLTNGTVVNDLSSLKVTRSASVATLSAASPVVQQFITLANEGDATIATVEYLDLLKDAYGNIIEEQVWDLGDVLPGEEIQLGYTITFVPDAPDGQYSLSSLLRSGASERLFANGALAFLGGATARLADLSEGTPVVLGVTNSGPIMARETPAPPDDETAFWNRTNSFDAQAFFTPALAAHSVSTVTKEHMGQPGLLTLLWSRLFGFVSSLIATIALAMDT